MNQEFLRFQVLTAASMMFRVVFWDILPCKMIVDKSFYTAAYPRRQLWTWTKKVMKGPVLGQAPYWASLLNLKQFLTVASKLIIDLNHWSYTVRTKVKFRNKSTNATEANFITAGCSRSEYLWNSLWMTKPNYTALGCYQGCSNKKSGEETE
jgi:hypothetical protein